MKNCFLPVDVGFVASVGAKGKKKLIIYIEQEKNQLFACCSWLIRKLKWALIKFKQNHVFSIIAIPVHMQAKQSVLLSPSLLLLLLSMLASSLLLFYQQLHSHSVSMAKYPSHSEVCLLFRIRIRITFSYQTKRTCCCGFAVDVDDDAGCCLIVGSPGT